MKKIALALLLLIVSIKSFSQALGFSLPEGKDKVVIPFEIYNNLVVVPVVLNGKLPLKFILDTGVRTSILTQKAFSDILNLEYARKYSIAGPGGEKLIDAYVTNNVSLQLPGIRSKGHALLVLEEDYLELRNFLGVDVHGILGYEIFSRFVVKIDYAKRLLTLSLPSHKKFKRFTKVHMVVEDTKPYIFTEIQLASGKKIKVKLLIDSGASHGLMLDPSTDSAIQAPALTVSSVIGRGLGGEITGKVGRINYLGLGEYKLEHMIVNFPDPNSYFDSLKTGNSSRNGSIGGDLLSRFTVIYDFPEETLYLKKNVAFKKKFYYSLSGLYVKAKGSRLNVFELEEVRKNSNAEKAGLKKGDIIRFLNGHKNTEMDLNMVNSILNMKPGKRIRIVVERGREEIKTEFLLEDVL